ncbi:hypothetical protein EVAR_71306_1 [Eumeta japonica]|uniref:Uncharacterized protein n=1 Tax=Eumeta variegata TaxID=151549 RepID=A0A4C2A934_EUMVA|nr:hypothetical protein EVAR_71306_1 [Eumeta japonica]
MNRTVYKTVRFNAHSQTNAEGARGSACVVKHATTGEWTNELLTRAKLGDAHALCASSKTFSRQARASSSHRRGSWAQIKWRNRSTRRGLRAAQARGRRGAAGDAARAASPADGAARHAPRHYKIVLTKQNHCGRQAPGVSKAKRRCGTAMAFLHAPGPLRRYLIAIV